MDKRIFRIMLLLAVCIVSYSLLTGDIALAANNQLSVGAAVEQYNEVKLSGLGSDFDTQLRTIYVAFITITHVLLIVSTAVGGIMLGLGIEEGKRTLWNWVLGIWIASGFIFICDTVGFFDFIKVQEAAKGASSAVDNLPQIKIATNDEKWTTGFLADFMKTYLDGIIKPGAKAILPYCVRIMIVLATIEVGYNMAFKLISGDKVKYLLTMLIKMGFFIWLMTNWISLTEALGNGFQQIGFIAGGSPNLQANSIGDNADKMVTAGFQLFDIILDSTGFLDGIGLVLLTIVGIVVILIATFFTALEMFMARIEFYTMALITMPLLPFMITSKFSFLGDKAVGAMFNLAIKVSVIAFITAFAVPFMQTFADKVAQTNDFWKQIGVIFQCVLGALMVFYLTKKMPELVSGLLNGQPSLGGASMVDTAKAAGGAAVGAAAAVTSGVGTVRAASAIAKGLSKDGKGGLGGTLWQLTKAGAMNTRPVQKYRNAFQKMDSLVGAGRQSASNMRTNMKLGHAAGGRTPEDAQTMQNLFDHSVESKTGLYKDRELSPREQKQLDNLRKNFGKYLDTHEKKTTTSSKQQNHDEDQ